MMERPSFSENPLDFVPVRVLGSLIEKELTTPDNYPLTLNALTAACNQASNRDPVMQLDEATVMQGLDELARRQLARAVQRADSRVRRYRHIVNESLTLHPPEVAVLCVLLLRGPQTVGEIRTRTARLFEFRDLPHVEVTLQSLMTLGEPLVVQLPRQPGQKEIRYGHLLAGQPQVPELPEEGVAVRPGSPGTAARVEALEAEVALLREESGALRSELALLRDQFDAFRQQFQ
jgi:uncharacterized protein